MSFVNQDNLFDIVLHLDIHDLQNIILTSVSFNHLLSSPHFWSNYFKQYGLIPKHQGVPQSWINLFINGLATKIVNDYQYLEDTIATTLVLHNLFDVMIDDPMDIRVKNHIEKYGSIFQAQLIHSNVNHGYILDIQILDENHHLVRTSPFYLTKEMAIKYLEKWIRHHLATIL